MTDLWRETLAAGDTSHQAKLSVLPHVPRLQAMVLDAIRLHTSHGATDDEIEQFTGLSHQTASARRRELVLRGQIYADGRRRKTRNGRSACVWVLA